MGKTWKDAQGNTKKIQKKISEHDTEKKSKKNRKNPKDSLFLHLDYFDE